MLASCGSTVDIHPDIDPIPVWAYTAA